MVADQPASGRVKSVLVVGTDQEATAVISTLIVRICDAHVNQRLTFTGIVYFDESSVGRMTDVLVPIVDRILDGLGLPCMNYEVAVVNLAGASVVNVGTRISGFSAEIAVFMALLSASLQIPVPDDLVLTGHLASPDGDIRAVQAIPAKLKAAVSEDSIRRFIHPDLNCDRSLEILSPKEYQQATEALLNANEKLHTIGVGDVFQLTQAVLEAEDIVIASLRQDFFETNPLSHADTDPVVQVAQFLGTKNEERFWNSLGHRLIVGDNERVKALLDARIQYHIRHRTYPVNWGHQLRQLVMSLPPAIRRLKTLFPLLSMSSCIEISQFASEEDHDDVQQLIEASSGKFPRTKNESVVSSFSVTSKDCDRSVLEMILMEIDKSGLASNIGLPIDSARACYVIPSVTVESYEEFTDSVSGFYLHLLRHARGAQPSKNTNGAYADSFDLLERAFSKQGGAQAAWAEAKEGTQGGLRFIFDVLTEQFKTEEKAKHVNRVLKEALDPLDWDARVALMAILMQRLGSALPEQLRSAPPERFARRWEILVQAYVQSLDQIKHVLRTY